MVIIEGEWVGDDYLWKSDFSRSWNGKKLLDIFCINGRIGEFNGNC